MLLPEGSGPPPLGVKGQKGAEGNERTQRNRYFSLVYYKKVRVKRETVTIHLPSFFSAEDSETFSPLIPWLSDQ